MLTRNTLIQRPPLSKKEGLVVNGNFMGNRGLYGASQCVVRLTVAVREAGDRQYYLRVILSLLPGVFLHSQDQPARFRERATRLTFLEKGCVIEKESVAEIGKQFTHFDGARGIRPCTGEKITFIQQIGLDHQVNEISGILIYQPFTEHVVMEQCMEEFSVKLAI